jgi:hypothetical protein
LSKELDWLPRLKSLVPVGDLRSLALFRILVAALLLLDLANRVPDLVAFYTDKGVMPRALLLEGELSWFCLHLASGDPWTQGLLFLLAAWCAWKLLIGQHTRWMTFASWALLSSLVTRNGLVCDRGHEVLQIMLFWGFFLPLGARWSRDAQRYPEWKRLPDPYRSLAYVATVIQFVLIYFFTGILKSGPSWTVRHDALVLSFRSATFGTPLSYWISQHGSWLIPLCPVVLALETFAVPLLLVSPIANQTTRLVCLIGLMVFHLQIFCLFHLGLFPLINIGVSAVLLPPLFWAKFARPLEARIATWFGSVTACTGSRDVPPGYRLHVLECAVLLNCVIYCCYCNLCTLRQDVYPRNLVEPMRSIGTALQLQQHWDLFSPDPPVNGWFLLEADLANGSKVDLFHPGQPLTYVRPLDPAAMFPSNGWKMLMVGTIHPLGRKFRSSLCRYWAKRYPPGRKITHLRYLLVAQEPDDKGQPSAPYLWTLWEGSPEEPPAVPIATGTPNR